MPRTKKGNKILRAMRKFYGKEIGTRIFYATEKMGKLKGVVRKTIKRSHQKVCRCNKE